MKVTALGLLLIFVGFALAQPYRCDWQVAAIGGGVLPGGNLKIFYGSRISPSTQS